MRNIRDYSTGSGDKKFAFDATMQGPILSLNITWQGLAFVWIIGLYPVYVRFYISHTQSLI